MSDRKQPGVLFWVTVAVVVILVGYPLSLFPIAWLDNSHVIPPDSNADRVFRAYCAPVRWVCMNGPDWLNKAVRRVYGK